MADHLTNIHTEGSINQSGVNTKEAQPNTGAPDQIKPRKRPHSEVITPNKQPEKPPKVYTTYRSPSSEHDSDTNLSDIAELESNQSEGDLSGEEAMEVNTTTTTTTTMADQGASQGAAQGAPKPPKVQIDEGQFAEIFLNVMATPAYKENMVLISNDKIKELHIM